MRELAAPLDQYLLTKAAGALPVPANAGDGADITGWRTGVFGPTRAVVYLYGTAATLTNVWLWGRRLGRWHRLGQLNGGNSIPITSATQGYSEPMGIVGIYDELAVSADSAIAITQQWEPIEYSRG